MEDTRFASQYAQGSFKSTGYSGEVIVRGVILDSVKNDEISYLAASPTDRRASFSGSGLPFPNQTHAFENTPNKGKILLKGNAFEFTILYPNSYYVELGRKLIQPTVYIQYYTPDNIKRVITIDVGTVVPYRTLEYPRQYTLARNDATFYHAHHNLPVRTQEQIMRDSAYPSTSLKMDKDFWGLKPAL